jgi:hypothetical protein
MGFSISIEWEVDDVLELDDELTEAQCEKVLRMAEKKHDANVGINWDVLQYWIDEIKGKVEE